MPADLEVFEAVIFADLSEPLPALDLFFDGTADFPVDDLLDLAAEDFALLLEDFALLPDLAPLEDLPVFEDFAAPEDFAPFEPPFDFEAVPLWFTSAKSPTASAATFRALTAAPVAAPVRISPATSFALLNKLDEPFPREEVFFAPEDFLADEVFDEDFPADDLADDADLPALCFALEFFAAEFFAPEVFAVELFAPPPFAAELFALDLAEPLAADLFEPELLVSDFLAADLPSSFFVGILSFPLLIILII